MLLGAVTTLRPNITPKWVLIPQINMYLTLIWALIPRIVLDTHSILSSCIVHIKTMYSLYGLYICILYSCYWCDYCNDEASPIPSDDYKEKDDE